MGEIMDTTEVVDEVKYFEPLEQLEHEAIGFVESINKSTESTELVVTPRNQDYMV